MITTKPLQWAEGCPVNKDNRNKKDKLHCTAAHTHAHAHKYLAPGWQFGLVVRVFIVALKLTGAPAVVCIHRTSVSLHVFINHVC